MDNYNTIRLMPDSSIEEKKFLELEERYENPLVNKVRKTCRLFAGKYARIIAIGWQYSPPIVYSDIGLLACCSGKNVGQYLRHERVKKYWKDRIKISVPKTWNEMYHRNVEYVPWFTEKLTVKSLYHEAKRIGYPMDFEHFHKDYSNLFREIESGTYLWNGLNINPQNFVDVFYETVISHIVKKKNEGIIMVQQKFEKRTPPKQNNVMRANNDSQKIKNPSKFPRDGLDDLIDLFNMHWAKFDYDKARMNYVEQEANKRGFTLQKNKKDWFEECMENVVKFSIAVQMRDFFESYF